jgi:hypothetical protein
MEIEPETPLLDSGKYDHLEIVRQYCGNHNRDTIGRFRKIDGFWDFLWWCRGCGRKLDEPTEEDLERLIEQALQERGDGSLPGK